MGMVIAEILLGVFCVLKKHDVNVDVVSFVPIITLATFIVAFNIGYGPLPWVMLAELFPANVKSMASAFVSTFVWILSFIVTKYFDKVVKIFGLGEIFLFFGFCCIIAALFSVFYVVETKGRSFSEIQELLNK